MGTTFLFKNSFFAFIFRNIKTFCVLMGLFLLHHSSFAQVRVPVKIDTSQQKIKVLYNFINAYMQKDTINNEMWHPKYKNRKIHDYTMDWTWGEFTPRQISKRFDIELSELQCINDTLSYFKISTKSKSDKNQNSHCNVYKYYIVKIGDTYYLDNCKEYDSDRFRRYSTKNLEFYISPFYKIEKNKMEAASKVLDTMYSLLKRPNLKKPIAYYMCSSEEELNNLSNIVIWDGGLGGFTNIPEAYVVAINDNPIYTHEFIHAILGQGANCFFLQEGIASLYGGMNKGAISYQKGLEELREGYKTEKYSFDDLYFRKVKQQYSSSLTYTFAAVFCKYLIENYGLDYFYKLYYDPEITSNNFLEMLVKKTGKNKKQLKEAVEKLILKK
ncbi:hypothetical protein B0O44_103411 [Pedobacter nutrimenti]|uniref:Peptidase MA superfamily protein n=1 Tax=Pedobacter nutrimenti TaxID=1241337 RepID=A0A318ULN2_9SPHI|nr:hypothetical protein B0O44_103411 [Pedobacter nutrimenti]